MQTLAAYLKMAEKTLYVSRYGLTVPEELEKL